MTTNLEKPLVCVIDDNPDLSFIFTAVLDKMGFQVKTINDGQEALTFLQTHAPILVVLDVNMPYVSGLEVLNHIRNNPELNETKVIIITGDTQAVSTPEAKLADLLLVKPVEVEHLIVIVERLLQDSE